MDSFLGCCQCFRHQTLDLLFDPTQLAKFHLVTDVS